MHASLKTILILAIAYANAQSLPGVPMDNLVPLGSLGQTLPLGSAIPQQDNIVPLGSLGQTVPMGNIVPQQNTEQPQRAPSALSRGSPQGLPLAMPKGLPVAMPQNLQSPKAPAQPVKMANTPSTVGGPKVPKKATAPSKKAGGAAKAGAGTQAHAATKKMSQKVPAQKRSKEMQPTLNKLKAASPQVYNAVEPPMEKLYESSAAAVKQLVDANRKSSSKSFKSTKGKGTQMLPSTEGLTDARSTVTNAIVGMQQMAALGHSFVTGKRDLQPNVYVNGHKQSQLRTLAKAIKAQSKPLVRQQKASPPKEATELFDSVANTFAPMVKAALRRAAVEKKRSAGNSPNDVKVFAEAADTFMRAAITFAPAKASSLQKLRNELSEAGQDVL